MARRRRGATAERSSRFGVYLKPDVHQQLLDRADQEDRSATDLIEALLDQYLGTSFKGKALTGSRRRRELAADELSRFGIYLKPEMHEQLLHRAIQEGRSATDLVEQLIEKYLATPFKGKAPKHKRGTRRTSPTR